MLRGANEFYPPDHADLQMCVFNVPNRDTRTIFTDPHLGHGRNHANGMKDVLATVLAAAKPSRPPK